MDYEVLSFYQAFRDGRMPIGVSNYATFNLLLNAAPELADSWDIAPYPGIKNDKGEVLRYTSGAAESCVVFNSSKNTKAAWDFVDWWTSTEVQTEFAYTLQSTLGNEYLWNSANLDAIQASPWSTKFKKVIMDQISWTYEAPRVPGSYIIERELGNVLVNVVTNGTNLRTAVDDAEKKIDRELQRKLEEFGYIDSKGNIKKELVVPDIDLIKEWLK
jgi:ABC-type glycerol-3-phosphate transport system substrate-binding protein